ncbi:MAG: NAD(P)H-hydrate epimerase [Lachnospiraceae bacterium]|nr:NAD(P)H-hydrate epimerase [Lachnospiraceae bacterium]
MPDKNGDINTACITGTVAKAADRYAMDVMGLKSLTLMETASSKIAGDYRLFIEEANCRSHGFVLAIDAPSGINTDTGELMGCGIKADVTITFGRNKTGLACGAGQNLAGRVLVEDIGIPDEAYIEAEKHL